MLAQRVGLRIHEVPVDWTDDPGTTVSILATAKEDLRGIWRLGRGLASGGLPLDRVRAGLRDSLAPLTGGPKQKTNLSPSPGVRRGLAGQSVRFSLVGVASTLAYCVLYLAPRAP